MKEVHKGMGITNAQFDAFVADTREVAGKRRPAADVTAILKAINDSRKDVSPKEEPETEPKPAPARPLGPPRRPGGRDQGRRRSGGRGRHGPPGRFLRGGKFELDAAGVARLKKLLVEQISSLTGGPLKYDGLGMKEAHKGMGITVVQSTPSWTTSRKFCEKNKVAPGDVATIVTASTAIARTSSSPPRDPGEEARGEETRGEETRGEETGR